MIKDTYLVIGVIYLMIALIYLIGVVISTIITIMSYVSSDKDSKKGTDTNSISYKVYTYYNNFRYGIFVILYIAIGVLYILENQHIKKTGH